MTATTYRNATLSRSSSPQPDDELPAHGTTARAKGRPASGIKGCRCPKCVHAEYVYNKAREVAALAGQPYSIGTAAVADHIDTLLAAGATANGDSCARPVWNAATPPVARSPGTTAGIGARRRRTTTPRPAAASRRWRATSMPRWRRRSGKRR